MPENPGVKGRSLKTPEDDVLQNFIAIAGGGAKSALRREEEGDVKMTSNKASRAVLRT